MADPSVTAPIDTPVSDEPRPIVYELCELLSHAGAVDFVPLLDDGTRHDTVRLDRGWVLSGGDDPAQRRAAAELLVRLVRAEREIGELCGEIVERYEEASLIYRLSRTLATVRGRASLSSHVVDQARQSLRCRSAELWLLDGETVTLGAASPALEDRSVSLNEQGPLAVLKEGRPWFRNPGGGHEAVLAVPLPGPQTKPAGVIILRGSEPATSFTSGDVKLVNALAALASAFLRSDRPESDERTDPVATEAPATVDTQLVGTSIPGLEIAGRRLEAVNGGTDRVDWLRLSDGGLLIAIAEGTGPGNRAAVRTATVRGALLAEARRVHSPAELARRVADAVTPDLVRAGAFVSIALTRVLPGARAIEWCNAGHHPPLLLRDNGDVETLETGGPVLGLLTDAHWIESAGELEPEELLVLYSDGLVDARDRQGSTYGTERLTEILRTQHGLDAASVVEAVIADHRRFAAGCPQHDDVTLVVVRAVPYAADGYETEC